MRKLRRQSRIAATAVALACSAAWGVGLTPIFDSQLRAGTIRHDISDQLYLDLGNDPKYAPVGGMLFNGFLASGVLISPKFVLTAAHTVDTPGTRNFNLGSGVVVGSPISINDSYHFAHPSYGNNVALGFDIGLVKLDGIVTTINPSSRFFYTLGESTEQSTLSDLGSKEGTFVGYGQSGNGLTGAPMGAPPVSPQSASGTKRGERNDLDALGSARSYSNNILLSDFDSPAGGTNTYGGTVSAGTGTLEGMLAPGDSGGGAFVDINGRTYLAGINSFLVPVDGNGNASYTDLFGVMRVSQHNQYIDNNVVNYWNSTSSGTFGSLGGWTLGVGGNAATVNPTTGDIAGFNQVATYTLTMTSSVDNHQLLARAGDVSVNLGGNTYTLTSQMSEGAMVVARYASESATVNFSNGIVNTRDVLIGQMSGSNGRLIIGSGATMNVTGDVYVGGSALAPLHATLAGGNGTLVVANSNSSVNVSGMLKVLPTGTVNFNAGSLSVGTLDISSGGRVNVASGGNKVLRTKWLNIASNGRIDLTDNDMIVTDQSISLVKNFIASGYANGAWNGTGIITSTPASDTRFGYGQANTLGLGTFDGVPVSGANVLVKYTYSGDANLDGMVDSIDLGLLALGWNTSGLWTSGDFNYDGLVNVGDLKLFAANWMKGVTAPLSEPLPLLLMASLGIDVSDVSAVPEPASLGALGIAMALMTRRRKR